MRRFSLSAVMAFAAPALLAAPAALAQYDAGYSRGNDDTPAAIALFADEDYYGEIRDVFDPFKTLNDLSFNDRARSVAVFAGQWELCEHKNFTGRCVFINRDVDDLAWFGLADRVTSVRPIFEYTEASHGLLFSRDRYGYIRYAHNETYGDDTWNYGYASSWGLSLSHYGYSDDYHRYGYYSPSWGYDPYGFAWGPRGRVRYTSTYRRHPRPSVINPYWVGWDWHRSDWQRGDWSWRDHRRGDDWRDGRGGGHGGRDWRRGDDDDDRGGRGGDWRPDDRRGTGDGTRGGDGRRGTDVVVDPVPVDPRPGRGDRGGRDWRPDVRDESVVGGPRTGRGGRSTTPDVGFGGDASITDIPADVPREPRGSWRGRGGDPGGGAGADPGGLLGGPAADVTARRGGGDDGWRGRGRDGDTPREVPRFGEGMSGGGIFGTDAPRSAPQPDFSPPPEPRPEVNRESRSDDGGGDSARGAFRRRDKD